ncbi:hypothetical protein DSO57_1011215 [Entomophthora muscae]|uniref:Uncharacterized protein n=1 Tax=Entomophthora muscae TaxID=34485 RepID=A0ACC2RL20_9FUNG|nr:hypothetical protein DSO57_1011215 [Entomophthora muscae]
MAYYVAFLDATAWEWAEADITLENSCEWAKYRWAPKECTTWSKTNFSPHKAGAWASKGLNCMQAAHLVNIVWTPKEYLEWRPFDKIYMETMHKWKEVGFMAARMRYWENQQMNTQEALEWAKLGVDTTTNSMTSSLNMGRFTLVDWAKWKEAGFRFLTAANWFVCAFNMEAAVEWGKLEFSPEEAAELCEEKISPKVAQEWKNKGFKVPHIKEWMKATGSPDMTFEFFSQGLQSDKAAEWIDNEVDNELAWNFHLENWSPIDLQNWCAQNNVGFQTITPNMKEFFAPDTAVSWLQQEIGVGQACLWSTLKVTA